MISPPACSNAWPRNGLAAKLGPSGAGRGCRPRRSGGSRNSPSRLHNGPRDGRRPGSRPRRRSRRTRRGPAYRGGSRPRCPRPAGASERGDWCGESEDRVIQRRSRGGGDEPVGPHVGHRRAGQPGDLGGEGSRGLVAVLVVLEAVGVAAEDLFPEVALVPADVALVDRRGRSGRDRWPWERQCRTSSSGC